MTLNTRFRATTRIAAIQCSCCNFYGNGPSGWRAPSSLVDLYNRGQCAPRIPSSRRLSVTLPWPADHTR